MPDVVMPRLSDSMEEGTILKWLKAEGDEVAKGDDQGEDAEVAHRKKQPGHHE